MAAPGQTASPNLKVAELQRVLATYAQATGFAAANPGAADGYVGTRTIMAVVAVAPQIPGLPSDIKTVLPLAAVYIATAAGQKQAKDLITKNASSITKALLAMAVLRIVNPPGGTSLVLNTGATALPGGGSANAIWFYDTKHNVYRVAVPRGIQGLGAPYIEISTSSTPPAGTQVSKNTFLVQIGQWYKTPWGIATLVGAGSVGIGGLGFGLSKLFR